MKKHVILLLIFLCCVVSFSFSGNAVLEYLEGTLQRQVNGKWQDLYEGDEIPLSAMLKAGNNTLAELSFGDETITIYKKGTYSLEKLVRESEEMGIWEASSILTRKIELAFVGGKDGDEKNLGVRAAQPEILSKAEEIGWYDELALIFKEGYNALKKGEYEKAAASFKKCLGEGPTSEEKEECLFYLSSAYILLGKTGFALKYINQMINDTGAYYFEEYAMMKGKLLIQVMEYSKALKILELAAETHPKGIYIQYIYYLHAVCYNGLNKTDKQKEYLEKTYAADQTTDVGKSAKEQLDSL